jgi:hypothetical protein
MLVALLLHTSGADAARGAGHDGFIMPGGRDCAMLIMEL